MFQALLTSFTNETVKRIKPCSFKDARSNFLSVEYFHAHIPRSKWNAMSSANS